MFAFYSVLSGSRNFTILFYIFPTLVSYRYSTVIIMKRRLCLLVSIFLYWGYFCTPGELLWHFIVDFIVWSTKIVMCLILDCSFYISFYGSLLMTWFHDFILPSKAFFVTASIISCNNKYLGLCLLSVYSII